MSTWQVLVVVFAAVALGLAAFAVWLAWSARGTALDAQSRIARHTREHRLGIEDEGLPRHRQGQPPLTEQAPAVRTGSVEPDRPVRSPLPPDDLPETTEHGLPTGPMPQTGPGERPNFRTPPPALPRPGSIPHPPR